MNGLHDVRLPAGPQAAALAELWTIMLWVCVLVFVLAMAALAISIRRAASNRHEGKAPAAIDSVACIDVAALDRRWCRGLLAAPVRNAVRQLSRRTARWPPCRCKARFTSI
jgi:hypothetical protein